MNSYCYLSALIVMTPLAVTAQAVPDNTMGSQVIQNIKINDILSDRIDAGQQRGNNLFQLIELIILLKKPKIPKLILIGNMVTKYRKQHSL